MSESRFAGTIALITGGSSGIGRATALSFAREGAKVVIASRGAEQGEAVRHELEALGGEAEFIPTDVSQSSQVELLMGRTIARFGRLDYAFNNAAAIDIGVFKPSADFSEEEFDKTYRLQPQERLALHEARDQPNAAPRWWRSDCEHILGEWPWRGASKRPIRRLQSGGAWAHEVGGPRVRETRNSHQRAGGWRL